MYLPNYHAMQIRNLVEAIVDQKQNGALSIAGIGNKVSGTYKRRPWLSGLAKTLLIASYTVRKLTQ